MAEGKTRARNLTRVQNPAGEQQVPTDETPTNSLYQIFHHNKPLYKKRKRMSGGIHFEKHNISNTESSNHDHCHGAVGKRHGGSSRCCCSI